MAIRSQLRLDQLTGSLSDAGAAGSVDPSGPAATSLQGSLDALAAGVKRITGGTAFYSQAAGVFNHTVMKVSGTLLDCSGDLRVAGNDILGGTGPGVRAMTLNNADVHVAGNVKLGTNVLQASDGGNTITLDTNDKVTFLGDLDHADANWTIGPTITTAGSLIQLGGGGTVVAGGDVRLAASGIIEDSGGHARLTATDAGVTAIGRADGTTAIEVQTDSDVHLAGNVLVAGNIEGDADEAKSIFAQSTTAGNAITIGGGADVVTGGDLKVTGNDIKSSTGATAITLQKGNVILPGNLTVQGTTTTIDTTNLEVEDKIVGLNYTSGSTAGALGDAGFIIGNSGGNQVGFWWDNNDSKFYIAETTSGPGATSIAAANTGRKDLGIRNLYLSASAGDGEGGRIFNADGSRAITLGTGATPITKIRHALAMRDSKTLSFGADADGTIQHVPGSSALQFDVANGQNFRFQVNSTLAAIMDGTSVELNSAGAAAIIKPSGTKELHLSGAGGDMEIMSGKDLYFGDKYRQFSTWSVASGIKLAANAVEWNNFETAYGEVSLLNAIVAAGGGAGTLQKRTVEVTGSGFPSGHLVPLNLDLDQLALADIAERVDVFVNGQLLASSSDVAGNGDYGLDNGASALNGSAVKAKFQFNLLADDVVQAVVR